MHTHSCLQRCWRSRSWVWEWERDMWHRDWPTKYYVTNTYGCIYTAARSVIGDLVRERGSKKDVWYLAYLDISHIYMYIYIHIYINTYICRHTYMHIYIYVCYYIYIFTHVILSSRYIWMRTHSCPQRCRGSRSWVVVCGNEKEICKILTDIDACVITYTINVDART